MEPIIMEEQFAVSKSVDDFTIVTSVLFAVYLLILASSACNVQCYLILGYALNLLSSE